MTGKIPDTYPVVNGHAAAVLDTDWNPFNDYIVASGSEDAKVNRCADSPPMRGANGPLLCGQAMIWRIPEGGLTELMDKPLITLSG